LIRSAGSVGANYIEAKESAYWLKLSSPAKPYENTKIALMCECDEFMKIFGAIIRNTNI
jgi:hypothetical protein